MKDLTILYYTANKLKKGFDEKVRAQLVKAARDYPIISVSQKPIDLGRNICVGNIGQSHINIFKQMLIGLKEVKTKYVAFAEDDTLYSEDHFDCYRPAEDVIGYDLTKWSVYTWKDVYSVKHRITNSTLIAPTKLVLEALEERFNKAADKPLKFWGEFGKYEKHLGVTEQKVERFYSTDGVVMFSHPEAVGYQNLGSRKKLGEYRAYDIPYWGHINKMLEIYND